MTNPAVFTTTFLAAAVEIIEWLPPLVAVAATGASLRRVKG